MNQNVATHEVGSIVLTIQQIDAPLLKFLADELRKNPDALFGVNVRYPDSVRVTRIGNTVIELYDTKDYEDEDFYRNGYFRQVLARIGGLYITSSNGLSFVAEDDTTAIEAGDFSSLPVELFS